MRYYIADCHFYHRNLLTQMDNLPFESVGQMNEYMIEKWNKKVHAHDEVAILGAFSLGSGEETNQILHRLKGKLFLIRGNHDDRYLKDMIYDDLKYKEEAHIFADQQKHVKSLSPMRPLRRTLKRVMNFRR